MKYIFVCGCTISGVGKGTFVCNLGILLQNCGYTITTMKVDPYFNVDAGTMNPFEHGETYVLKDGGETDLDLGNYERALPISLISAHNLTSGKLYQNLIQKERKGDYLGKTVQMIPHVINDILDWIKNVSQIKVQKNDPNKENDICIIEIGGTVGDYESGAFYEAIRVFLSKNPSDDCLVFLVTWIPEIGTDKQHKTKPTQHGIRDFKIAGVFPNFVICRSQHQMSNSDLEKVAYYAHVDSKYCFSLFNSDTYNIINILKESKVHELVLKKLNLPIKNCTLEKYSKLYTLYKQLSLNDCLQNVKIAIVGKYTHLKESYHSLVCAITHASFLANAKLELKWIEAAVLKDNKEEYEKEVENIKREVEKCNGLLVPGGIINNYL